MLLNHPVNHQLSCFWHQHLGNLGVLRGFLIALLLLRVVLVLVLLLVLFVGGRWQEKKIK